MNGPNFLCIGAHKAGTTWLQKVLETHPDVFLPMKEIHFFDRDVSYPSPSYLADRNPLVRLIKMRNRTRNFQIARALVKSAITLNADRFRFFTRFLLTVDEQWYANLFVTRREYKIKGDITPAYSILRREDIRKIHDLNPAMKIIFILRNPIYRDWSACRYNITAHGHTVDSIEYFNSPDMMLRGDYLRTIENYENFFSPDQILYCFFDELIASPDKFYGKICRFLNIDYQKEEDLMDSPINKSPDLRFDPTIKFYLARRYLPKIEELAEVFGGYCDIWYQEAKEIVEQEKRDDWNISFPSQIQV